LFALTAASMGLLVYGPAILQQTRGLSPLWAGYAIGAEALAWTLAAFAVASVPKHRERLWVRTGAGCVLTSLLVLAIVMRAAPLGWVIAGASLMGVGFGLFSSLVNRKILAALSESDRSIGSAALIAVRQTGGAVGAAIAGATANLVGVVTGLTDESARAAAVWVFVTAVPVALVGVWSGFRLTSRELSAERREAAEPSDLQVQPSASDD
jgi:MFS family permease